MKNYSPFGFLRKLIDDFGLNFVIMLFCTYFGVKGALYSLYVKAQIPYYLDYVRTSGAAYQRYGTFSATPWAMKAAMGAVSDTIPLFGYHKAPYIVFGTILGVIGFFLLAVLPLGSENHPLDNPLQDDNVTITAAVMEAGKTVLAPMLFFAVSFQIAMVDILVEGRYARMMVEKPETGGSLVTWVWTSYFMGSLVVSAVVGPLADNFDPRVLFWLGIPLALQVLIPISRGCLQEEKVPPFIRTDKIKEEPRMYIMAVLMTLGALTNAILSVYIEDDIVILITTWSITSLLITTSYWALPTALANANTYMFLVNALYLLIPGVMDSWYTAGPDCVPDGPGFSNTYYLTYSGIVGSVAALVGVCVFQVLFKNSSFRRAFWTTTVVRVVACIFDIVIVERWHRPSVPDKVMYMFGDAIIAEIAAQLDFMPSVVLVSKLCPPGYESMVYAMLGGFQNFGMQVSRNTGGALASYLGVIASENEGICEFDNLPWLLFIAHMVFPLLTIPLTFVLIPNARMTDDILATTANPQGYNLEMYSICSDEVPTRPLSEDSFDNDANEALCVE